MFFPNLTSWLACHSCIPAFLHASNTAPLSLCSKNFSYRICFSGFAAKGRNVPSSAVASAPASPPRANFELSCIITAAWSPWLIPLCSLACLASCAYPCERCRRQSRVAQNIGHTAFYKPSTSARYDRAHTGMADAVWCPHISGDGSKHWPCRVLQTIKLCA